MANEAVEKKKDKSKKRTVVVEAIGQAHIRATFNNIVISMTNTTGQVVAWASGVRYEGF
jgi:small subunit ribosomal protein S11